MTLQRQFDHDDPVVDSRCISRDAFIVRGGALNRARVEPHLPRMQRADHRVARHDTVAERPAAVGALVVGGQEAIAEIEDGDLTSADRDCASFAERNALARRHAHPLVSIHARTFWSAWIGTNCDAVRGCRPSSHASTERAFERANRSRSPCRIGSVAYTVSLRTLSMPVRSTKS